MSKYIRTNTASNLKKAQDSIVEIVYIIGKNGNKRGGGWPIEGDSRSRSILKNKEARGTDSELLLQETTSLGANVSRKLVANKTKARFLKCPENKNNNLLVVYTYRLGGYLCLHYNITALYVAGRFRQRVVANSTKRLQGAEPQRRSIGEKQFSHVECSHCQSFARSLLLQVVLWPVATITPVAPITPIAALHSSAARLYSSST